MKEYIIKFLDSRGKVEDKAFTFSLENSATVSCLKKAVEPDADCPQSEFRLFFRQENGQNLGLDEDEVLEDVVNDSGQLLVECPSLGGPGQLFTGKVWIHKDSHEDVFLLLGSTKSFEHHKVPYLEAKTNMELPMGEINSFYIFICKQ